MTNLKLIYDVLINSTHTTINFQQLQKDLEVIEEQQQWDELFKRANLHGILPLVFNTLKSPTLDIDESVLSSFKQGTLEIAKENMLMSAELLRITKLLNAQDIKVTSFKGPVLSFMIHKDITLRQYSDIDILIDKRDMYTAAQLLINSGYSTDIDLKFLKNKQFIIASKDLAFIHAPSGVNLELHWKLFDPKFAIKSNDFFTSTQNIKLLNTTLKTFDTTNLLVYLCMHGSKHYWERIEWIVDIDRLVREYEIDWDVVQEQSVKLEIKTLVYVGLSISSKFFNTPIPEALHKDMNEHNSLVSQIIQTIYDDEISIEKDREKINLKNIIRHSSFKDSNSATLKAKIHSYLQLKTGDIILVNLPSYLTWFYYPLRLFRLSKKLLKRDSDV